MGSPLCVFACVAYYSECFSDLRATHSDLENCLWQDSEMAIVIYASNRFILCKGTESKPLALNLFQLTSKKIEQNIPAW